MTAIPAWLTAAVDQRMSLLRQALGSEGLEAMPIVMTTLTEPEEGEAATDADFERWERTCDNCGAYCPLDSEFFTGQATRDLNGTQVIITIGACPDCVGVGG